MADIITIEECITRLDVIRHELVPDSRDHFALSAGIAALYEMESGSPAVNRWIPCSERLPKEETNVIAVIDGCSREAFYSDNSFIGSNFYRKAEEVPYWMPKPEPPKEDET